MSLGQHCYNDGEASSSSILRFLLTSACSDLLPGHADDEIKINIFQTQLVRPVELAHPQTPAKLRLSLHQLLETLPSYWEVHETLAGRYVFRNRSSSITSGCIPMRRSTGSTMSGGPEVTPPTKPSSTGHVEREDGHQAHSLLQVPENLASALRYLRFPNRARTLWADSISINQANLPERNAHVKRMWDIYKLALNRYSAEVDYTSGLKRISASNPTHPGWHVSANELPFDATTWQAILDLSQRPWFDSLWVMQEIQLASQKSFLLCGPDHIDWPRFRRAAMCLRDLPHLSSPELVARIIELERLIAPIANTEFLRLLSRAHQRLCSGQRDKIYGMLAVASPILLSLMRPD
ncbi:hypothetical protein B0A55_06797 [Friedmanniomyces simplex]|uniref:Heterokaryon incompatibility domain-containing protein n=1 Tax=Friedmanniomyces simplex TaxID=329884 RepID=A0A4U0X7A8_9PEZI|nr:hypothetical protein B0A55_06797 [Friedmanniomyces simplex]